MGSFARHGRLSEIARHLGLKAPAVYSWKSRENWDGGSPAVRVAASAEMRLHVLIAQPKKSDADYKEMRQLFALVSGGKKADARQPDLNEVEQAAAPVVSDGLPWDVPTIDKPPRERRERENVRSASKPAPNSFTAEQVLRLQEIFREQMFEYQRIWFNQKVRFRNSIFLSASRAQAYRLCIRSGFLSGWSFETFREVGFLFFAKIGGSTVALLPEK